MAAALAGFVLALATAWLIARAARQFVSFDALDPAPANPRDAGLGEVAIIVPARNEADVIERCLVALRAQDYAHERLAIIIVDDGSTDATAALARQAAAVDRRVRLIEAGPLPPGWAGKPHACWRGATVAGMPRFFCFVDADTAARPALVRSAVREAEWRGLDLLSLEPRQEMRGFWERLVLPAGLFALAFSRDIRRVADPSVADASANGQFMLVRSSAYWRVGGHAAVKSALAEDSSLALALKSAGHRIAVLGGQRLIHTRMYRDFRGLWQGLGKTSTEALGGPARVLLVCGLGMPLAWAIVLAPVVLGLSASAGALPLVGTLLAAMAALAAIGLHVSGARHLGVPAWYGLLFPLGYTVAAAIALDGLRRRAQGRIPWKGRCYGRNVGYSPSPRGEG